MIAMSKKPRGYFDNSEVLPRVEAYLDVKRRRDAVHRALEILKASAELRRFRRQRSGGKPADVKLERAQADFGPLEAEYERLRGELCAKLYDMAHRFAKRFARGSIRRREDYDDLIQEGVVKAIEATPRYDVSRGTSLFAFWTNCIRYAWLPMLRKDRQQQKKLHKYATDRLGWTGAGFADMPQGRKRHWITSDAFYDSGPYDGRED